MLRNVVQSWNHVAEKTSFSEVFTFLFYLNDMPNVIFLLVQVMWNCSSAFVVKWIAFVVLTDGAVVVFLFPYDNRNTSYSHDSVHAQHFLPLVDEWIKLFHKTCTICSSPFCVWTWISYYFAWKACISMVCVMSRLSPFEFFFFISIAFLGL